MKKIRIAKRKERLFLNFVPNIILTSNELQYIKGGGVIAACGGANETLSASDFPDATDYLCSDGATLTNVIIGQDPSSKDNVLNIIID